jgi:hypothetical protein
MNVIIGSHFVPLESKFLLVALVIVRITLSQRHAYISWNVHDYLILNLLEVSFMTFVV